MLPLIFIGLVACVNGKPPDDALLQQHAQIMDSVGFGNLAMDTQRNELETRSDRHIFSVKNCFCDDRNAKNGANKILCNDGCTGYMDTEYGIVCEPSEGNGYCAADEDCTGTTSIVSGIDEKNKAQLCSKSPCSHCYVPPEIRGCTPYSKNLTECVNPDQTQYCSTVEDRSVKCTVAGYRWIKSNVECKSDDESLGTFTSLAACATACRNKRPCKFFIYGKNNKNGNCYWEKTSGASCPEGWENDSYDFFKLGEGSTA